MKQKKAEFPKQISRGGVTVKIYRAERERDGRTFAEFTLSYMVGKVRTRKVFADLRDAQQEADFALTKLTNAQHDVLKLNGADREEYVSAVAELKRTGRPLLTAIREYCDAFDRLGGKATLPQALDYFVHNFSPDRPERTVREVVAEMLKAKEADGLSEVYRKDLRLRLATFCKAFGSSQIGFIRSTQINAWLRSLTVSPRGRNNFRQQIVLVWNFARAQDYLPKDRATAADDLAKAKEKTAPVQIFTPSDVRLMLSRMTPELIPFAAISAFAGVRTEELMRLDWKDVRFEEGVIEVSADKAKTASHRHVPISANLRAWLAPYRTAKGRICRWKKTQLMVQTLAEKRVEENGGDSVEDGVQWSRNVLRHSFGSYRMAETKNAAQVALEMGNSPAKVFSNYRKPITAKDAADYFSIVPPSAASNVIQLGAQAAG